jgi:hypothetical protein
MTRLLVALMTLTAAALPGVAHAQSASAEADTLFDQARTLMDEGKYADACNAFDASQKLSPAVSTLFNQANCREKNEQLATAWGLFREAERQTRAPIDESTEKLNKVAVTRAKALEPRLSKLTVVVPDSSRVDGLTVVRDTTTLEVGMWNRALPIDGGRYTITARAPGYKPWSTTIEVAIESDVKTLDIPALELAPKPLAGPGTQQSARTGSIAVPLIIAGAAAALLGGALGAELSSRGDYDLSKREPDDARQDSLYTSANTKHLAAQGLAIAGVGALGVATWLYLRGRGGDEPAAPVARVRGVDVQPVVAADQAGFLLTRSF